MLTLRDEVATRQENGTKWNRSISKFRALLSVVAKYQRAGNHRTSQQQEAHRQLGIARRVARYGAQKSDRCTGCAQTEINPLDRAACIAPENQQNYGNDQIYRGKSYWTAEPATASKQQSDRVLVCNQLIKGQRTKHDRMH